MPELDLSCTECLDLCAEVALGLAEAEERAAVLIHVERCASCRAQLRSLSDVADQLTALAPAVQPPAGFESRVLSAIGIAPQPTPSRAVRHLAARPLRVAAAVVLATAIAVGGWLIGDATSRPSTPVVTAALMAERTTVGQVMVVEGQRAWITMSVSLPAGTTTVRCEVRDSDGVVATIGTFKIVGGHGYWAEALPWGMVVRAAKLVLPDGRVLASAVLAT